MYRVDMSQYIQTIASDHVTMATNLVTMAIKPPGR